MCPATTLESIIRLVSFYRASVYSVLRIWSSNDSNGLGSRSRLPSYDLRGYFVLRMVDTTFGV